MTSGGENHPQTDRIRTRAYMLWERDGRPDGHDLAHWVKAKEEIEAEDNKPKANDRSHSGLAR